MSSSTLDEAWRCIYKPCMTYFLLICVGTFFTIPPHDQVRQPLLYKPLLASLFLGISSGVVALFYGFRWCQPATLEAALLDQDKIGKEERIKDWLLFFCAICTVLAVLLRLSLKSLQVMAIMFVASIAVAIPFILSMEAHRDEIIPQTQDSSAGIV